MIRKILKASVIILIILGIGINFFSISKDLRKLNVEAASNKLAENSYDKDDGELEFNSSSLIVQAKSLDLIENSYNVESAINLMEDVYLVNFENSEETKNAYSLLKDDTEIDNVLKNYKVHISSVNKQYEAWGVKSTGMNIYTNKLFLNDNATEVKIAVLDTGINPNHEVFKNLTLGDRLDFTDSYDYVNKDDDVSDDNGHGTAVAGVVAESTPANVKIVPVKVMDSEGNGDFNDIIQAIRDLSTKVDIINLSLGTDISIIEPEDFNFIEGIFEEIVSESGVIIVCAAGNSNKDVEYPAASSYTLAASSIDESNRFANFSCYGNTIDFATPGVEVILPSYTNNSGYVSADGTSISAPFLASSVALVKAENPTYSKDQIVEALKRNAKDLGAVGKDKYYGYGSIDFKIDMFSNSVEINVENKTNKSAAVTFDGENASLNNFKENIHVGGFQVASNSPCFVLLTKDNGASFTVLEASENPMYNNVYKFRFNLESGIKIVIAIKGDIDSNGIVNRK